MCVLSVREQYVKSGRDPRRDQQVSRKPRQTLSNGASKLEAVSSTQRKLPGPIFSGYNWRG
jgi:hypothetical protein